MGEIALVSIKIPFFSYVAPVISRCKSDNHIHASLAHSQPPRLRLGSTHAATRLNRPRLPYGIRSAGRSGPAIFPALLTRLTEIALRAGLIVAGLPPVLRIRRCGRRAKFHLGPLHVDP